MPAQTTCQVVVLVTPSLAPPVLNSCTSLNVPERVPIGTSFGNVVSVKGSSLYSTYAYFIQTAVASPNPGVVAPFGVDCTGALFSARNILAAQASSYNVTLRVDNTAGGQTFSAFCTIIVGVVPKPVAPSVTNAALTTFDLRPNGTYVGNVGLVDNNNIAGQTATYVAVSRWATRDSPDAFAIDAQGNISVANAVLDTTQKTTYYYTLNASDAVSWAIFPIVISLLPTPRPPITFVQTFSIFEGSGANTAVPNGRLVATHPQSKSMAFALVQPSFPFVCDASGNLAVSPLATTAPATLQYNLQPAYVLTFTVTDSAGLVATSTATINLMPTNLPPVFSQPAGYSKVASEGLPSGAAVDTPLYATDPNPNDVNSFAIVTCSPLVFVNGSGVCPFTIDQITGQIKVSALMPGGVLKADANRSLATGYAPYAPFTYLLLVSCFDNGIPVMRSLANVTVTIANINPRWASPAITISVPPSQQVPGALVFSSLANTWTPYDNAAPPPGNFSVYTIISAASNASSFFSLDSYSGNLTVRPGAALNFNLAPLGFVMVLQIQDSRTNLFARTTLTVQLVHVNRAPFFAVSGPLYIPTASQGTVGPYMPNYVVDLDLAVIPAERLTYSITPCSPACNSSAGAFTIDAVTGQVSLPAPLVNTGPSQTVYTVNVTVVDAGIDSVPVGLKYSAWQILYFVLRDGVPRPYFQQSSFAVSIPENSAFGSPITTLQGFDSAWPSVTLTFSMTPMGTLSSVSAAIPFGITTVPSTTGPGSGAVTVKWSGRMQDLTAWSNLDYEAPFKAAALGGSAAGFNGFNVFPFQVVATDSNTGASQEVGYASLTITVTDVPESPFFAPNTRVPNSATFTLQIPEHTPYTNAVGAVAYNKVGTTLSFVYSGSGATVVTTSLGSVYNASTVVVAQDDDIADQGKLTYAWSASTPAATKALFTINPSTGVVTGSAAATALNYEGVRSYTLTAVVTDLTGLSDSATVIINLVDVNEVATFTTYPTDGLWTTGGAKISSGASGTITVPENSADQTTGNAGVARINSTDVDQDPLTGARVYTISSALGGLIPFSVRYDGLIQVNNFASGALDFEDRTSYTFTVTVSDGSSPSPLSANFTLTVLVTDVNDLTIDSVYADPASVAPSYGGTGSDLAINIVNGTLPAAYFNPLYAAFQPLNVFSLMRATGGARMILTGTNIGPTQSNIARIAIPAPAVVYSVTYGPTGSEYTAGACAVTAVNTQLSCTAVAGAGVSHRWRVNVTYPASFLVGSVLTSNPITGALPVSSTLSAKMTAYVPPTIYAVYLSASAQTDPNSNRMSTVGGTVIYVTGRDFGPLNTVAWLYYGSSGGYPYAAQCVVTTADVLAQCTSVPGVGGSLSFMMYIGPTKPATALPPAGTASAAFLTSVVQYALPTVAAIGARAVSPLGLDTRGNEVIVLNGSNYGPIGAATDAVVSVQYSASSWGLPYGNYSATKCTVSIAHVQLTCTSAPGVGAGLSFLITVAGQTMSSPSGVTLAGYRKPLISGLSGLGTNQALTVGGQIVLLTGDQFGPVTPTVAGALPAGVVPGGIAPIASYGKFVASYPLKCEFCPEARVPRARRRPPARRAL